jgi:hypothetical protein
VVYFSINEVGMEQLVQAAVGVQPLVEDLLATNNYVLNNEEELVIDDGTEKEDQELDNKVASVENEVDVANCNHPEEPNTE